MLSQFKKPSTEVETIVVRAATRDDVMGIVALVEAHARRGSILPRSVDSVCATIDDWLVAAAGDEVLGCVSLLPYSSGLVEVRSLAVQDRYKGLGIGQHLMEALIVEAQRRRLPTLFALTRIVGFFGRFGFVVSDRGMFPEKVWRDCQQCPFLHNCDETAVVLTLEESSE